MTTPTAKPLGYECRFAVYCPPPRGEGIYHDYHLVKEVVHHSDGTKTPNVRMWKDFKRPYAVTKKGLQNHKEKKEWEYLSNVQMYESTQSQLLWSAARALGNANFRGSLRELATSPYLYGSDILSTAVIKRKYQDQFPHLITPYSVATFDIETDVIKGTDEIIMATVSFGSKVFTAVQKSTLEGQSNAIPRLHALMEKYMGAMERTKEDGTVEIVNVIKKRGIEWEVIIVDNEVDIIRECFKRAHEWKPDFMAIWNIDFDMPKMVNTLLKNNVEPKDIFSDPKVPENFRHFYYKQGQKQKVTASGLVTPIKPPAQWHTVFCPASFYFVDAMCVYRHVRTGAGEEPSYALDAILKKHHLGGKLKFEEAEGLSKIDWHIYMQRNHILEYVIYNVFDCVSMEELDEVTNDMRLTMPLFSGCSDFEKFNSQPRRTADNLHYFCLERGRVIGSTGKDMTTPDDKLTIGLDGWITTLPAHLVVDNGLLMIEENPFMRTNIRAHVGDLDVSASYPNGGCVFNISRETTVKELIEIHGVDEAVRRAQGINLSGGHVNAVEFACAMYGLPDMETMLAAFEGRPIPKHAPLIVIPPPDAKVIDVSELEAMEE
jgi:hypothetical protein